MKATREPVQEWEKTGKPRLWRDIERVYGHELTAQMRDFADDQRGVWEEDEIDDYKDFVAQLKRLIDACHHGKFDIPPSGRHYLQSTERRLKIVFHVLSHSHVSLARVLDGTFTPEKRHDWQYLKRLWTHESIPKIRNVIICAKHIVTPFVMNTVAILLLNYFNFQSSVNYKKLP